MRRCGVDFAESEERRARRQSVSAIAAKFGHQYFADCSAAGRFPNELWEAIFSNGYGGVNLPERCGGGGGRLQELAIVIEDLAAQGCPLLFLIVAGMCGPVIAEFGTEEQRQRWLPWDRSRQGQGGLCIDRGRRWLESP